MHNRSIFRSGPSLLDPTVSSSYIHVSWWQFFIELIFLYHQMLVIAATEPCSFRHSDPPRTTDSLNPLASGLRTIPLRPMPKCQPGSPPPVIILPGRACKTPQLHEKNAASNLSAQTTIVTSSSVIAKEERSELQQKTMADKGSAMPSTSTSSKSLLSQPVSKPTPAVSASSAVLTAAPFTSETDQSDQQPESGQTEQGWQFRAMGMKSVLDFEKIYQFMSNLVLKKHTQPLTAMGMYKYFVNYHIYFSFLLTPL